MAAAQETSQNFIAHLSGDNEVPPRLTDGHGVATFEAMPAAARSNGNIARGTITAANLTGSLAGQPLSALLELMSSGRAYVNVHTNNGVAPAGTGAGDFPSGEIRGQIRTSD
jgi:hypothetical protein